jgi:hypothetical protein
MATDTVTPFPDQMLADDSKPIPRLASYVSGEAVHYDNDELEAMLSAGPDVVFVYTYMLLYGHSFEAIASDAIRTRIAQNWRKNKYETAVSGMVDAAITTRLSELYCSMQDASHLAKPSSWKGWPKRSAKFYKDILRSLNADVAALNRLVSENTSPDGEIYGHR